MDLRRKKRWGPIPRHATITSEPDGSRLATWKDGRTRRSSPVRAGKDSGGDEIRVERGPWVLRYTDAVGNRRDVSTGCTDRAAAELWARARLLEVERERAGVLTADERVTARRADEPIAGHVDAFAESLRARGRDSKHVSSMKRYLTLGADACGFRTLRDVDRERLQRWLAGQREDRVDALGEITRGWSARTANYARVAWKSFTSWCAETERIARDPVGRWTQYNEASDRRRLSRALTDDEISRLLESVEQAPLLAKLGSEGTHALSARTRERLRLRGLERRTIYALALGTGLRHNELASLTVGSLRRSSSGKLTLVLRAEHEKAGRGAELPVPADVVAEIDRLRRARQSLAPGAEIVTLGNVSAEPLFRTLPSPRAFDADLRAAGIEKVDPHGETLSFHSLRHTFGTRHARAGTPPQILRKLMRHASIDLTLRHYVHLETADLADAVEALPEFGTTPTRRKASGSESGSVPHPSP